jgi:ribonuclease HIII
VDGLTETQLITLGVRDSKLLSDHRILAMAETIKGTCPHFVVLIGPKTYNEMYERMQNLNQLLAWGHARSLEKVLEKVSCDLVIADQFGDESYLLDALGEKVRLIKLEQRPHAESDFAVAAASILARAEFVRRMEQLSSRVGKKLPKGAFDPSIITIGREIVAQGGESALADVAKLHFKTTKVILQN